MAATNRSRSGNPALRAADEAVPDDVKAVKREAEGDAATVEFDGKQYQLLESLNPWDFLELVESNLLMASLRSAFSQEDFNALKALRPTLPETMDIISQIAKSMGVDDLGGLRGLVDLIGNTGSREALEADLHEFYSLDLLDLFRGRLSWRKLSVLIRGLPVDSRTVTLQIDRQRDIPQPKRLTEAKVEQPMPTPREGATERLLRDVLDALRHLTWVTVAVQAGKKAPPAPKPAPRPTDPRPMAATAKKQLFEKWNERVKIADN